MATNHLDHGHSHCGRETNANWARVCDWRRYLSDVTVLGWLKWPLLRCSRTRDHKVFDLPRRGVSVISEFRCTQPTLLTMARQRVQQPHGVCLTSTWRIALRFSSCGCYHIFGVYVHWRLHLGLWVLFHHQWVLHRLERLRLTSDGVPRLDDPCNIRVRCASNQLERLRLLCFVLLRE
jgi:hypothetical protein